ncbi:response regulator [Desulfogranum mediterraneum]|uniref:response regulator n=1 Tax=Desulfogranum mediterraneum TaxID=160661 RepID=UPI000424191E|nr:response regulator [Desulfogranum mediterraneum]
MTILIADDDPVIRKLFEKRLTNAGYQVRVAVDGMDAAQQLHTSCFDIIITDLVMPGDIGGLELLQIAKQRHPRTEVIVITAHSSIDTAVNAMKNGAVDYLEKPINFDELFLRLDKIAEVNSLVKNAGDLREAMDVTESMAAKTIQNLEITAGDLQLKIDRLETILCDASRDQQDRIDEALDVIQR